MPALAVLIEQDKKFLNEQIRETFFSKDEGYTKTRKMQNFFHARGGRISEKLKKLSRTERALVLAVPGTLVAALVALFDGGTASGVGLYTLLKFVFATGGTVVVSSASSYGVIKAADRLAATKAGKPEESISVEELEKALSTRDEYRAKTDSANIAIGMGIGAFLGGSFQQMCHAFGITPFTLAHPVSGPKVNPVEQNVPVPKPRPNVYVPQEVKITHPSHKIVVAPVPPALVEASTVKTTPPPEAPAIIAPEVLSTPSETIPQHGNIYCLYPDGHLSKGFPKWHHHSNIPDYANFRSRGTTVTGENFDHYYNEVNPHPVNLNDPSGKLDSEWFVREKLDDVTSFHSNRTGETLITNTGGGFTVDTDPHIDDNFRERIFEKAKTDFFSGPNPKPFVFVDVVTGNISAPPSAVTPQMQVTPTGRRIPMQAPVPQK
ncbi:hypothetical protein HY090_02560 [Candidatus Kaiserbacteria bacterium]|nr:hypothetical protein [Candidatus Kaiserbacteria bacterium]